VEQAEVVIPRQQHEIRQASASKAMIMITDNSVPIIHAMGAMVSGALLPTLQAPAALVMLETSHSHSHSHSFINPVDHDTMI
jgi:hypothetical protein